MSTLPLFVTSMPNRGVPSKTGKSCPFPFKPRALASHAYFFASLMKSEIHARPHVASTAGSGRLDREGQLEDISAQVSHGADASASAPALGRSFDLKKVYA